MERERAAMGVNHKIRLRKPTLGFSVGASRL
ncbi:MAG: hypothetical protein FD172_2494 [Methylocystaceae bacterium]|nr:MAG: hypothetical protein FD172_2494 [Methylocystaceae bacterium]